VTAPVFVVPATALAAASVGDVVRLDGAEGRHAVAVRRLAVGEELDLVDGVGRRVRGTIASVLDKQSLDVAVVTVHDEPPPEPLVVVVQALPKGDRGELAVELLTEIGVDVIVPWAAANCVTQWKGDRVERAHRRWADAAQAAAKQARRARFPVVEPCASTADVLTRIGQATTALVLHEEAMTSIADVAAPGAGDLLLVVGPEGGLTPAERESFGSAGAREVRLGPSVLRTSSAGITAVAALLAPTPRWALPALGRAPDVAPPGIAGDGRMPS
jgi:16S rRNA (uracil1498-N3)-methyltransferase